MLEGDAPIVISSQLLNRQDGQDEYHVPYEAMGEGTDPRKAAAFDERVLLPDAEGRIAECRGMPGVSAEPLRAVG